MLRNGGACYGGASRRRTIKLSPKLKKRFIEGGPGFMSAFYVFILGLAIAIERIIYLNLSTSDSEKLTAEVESAMKSGGKGSKRGM